MQHSPYPPTPAPSTPSPTHQQHSIKFDIYPNMNQTETYLPPTPPTDDQLDSKMLTFEDAPVPQRPKRGRRPLSAYPSHEPATYIPHRKYTDPTPRPRLYDVEDNQQLDVDLDAYSEDFDSREPTLSFVTTSSAAESTTGTPSLSATYSPKHEGGAIKPEVEPRIRMRTTTGRANAYSSAESSGAYSYHGYDNQVVYHQPPPLPVMPDHLNERIGLGISNQVSDRSSIAPSPDSSISPVNQYEHRPWRSDLVNRLRSDSASSSFTTTSTSTDDTGPSVSAENYSAYHYTDRLPWESEEAECEAEAVTMIDEGREKILNKVKLEDLGGLGGLSQDAIRGLAGTTHLLLPSVGPGIIPLLPELLDILAPSLVVLDISTNDITFLPEALQRCTLLEELNVTCNPLRALPPFMGNLINLRMLAADDCGLQSLPAEMSHLGSIHTLCARRNRLVSLPPWLCLFSQLETLKVDGNPFAKEWTPIVAPILSNPPLSVRAGPYISSSTSHSKRLNEHDVRSIGSMASLTSSMTASSIHSRVVATSPSPSEVMSPIGSTSGSFHQISSLGAIAEDQPHSAPIRSEDSSSNGSSKMLKKMRSFGSILDNHVPTQSAGPSRDSSFNPTTNGNRFGSLGAAEGRKLAASAGMDGVISNPVSHLAPGMTASTSNKAGKWGFLRKMSMNRLKSTDKSLTMTASASANIRTLPPPLHHTNSDPVQTLPSPSRPGFRAVASSATLPARHMMSSASEFGQINSESGSALSDGHSNSASLFVKATGPRRGRRRSFLPVDTPPSISISIPCASPLMSMHSTFEPIEVVDEPSITGSANVESPIESQEADTRYSMGLESIKSYLRDLFDLSRPPIEPYGGFEVVNGNEANYSHPDSPSSANRNSISEARRAKPIESGRQSLASGVDSISLAESSESHGKKFKNDKMKRAKVLREIYETERTYVRGLGELVTIYVKPAGQIVNPGKPVQETVVPAAERKVVFGGVESILSIHRDNLLPALERVVKPLLERGDDEDGKISTTTAHQVGEVFRTYIAYMKQYSTYINNFDNALSRMQTWTTTTPPAAPSFGPKSGSATVASAAFSAGMSAVTLPTGADTVPHSGSPMTTNQRKRVKGFLKRCREHPMHSQINLESYLLLPIQRVPRYKLLLEDLAMCTPPHMGDLPRDTLDDALNEISGLASLMNEEKREADSRLRLYQWQQRITSRGPSPLVQPHRKLILDGSLNLIRLVKKASTFVEMDNTNHQLEDMEADHTIMPSKVVVPVEYIAPEPMDKHMVMILCSDLMVLAQPRSRHHPGQVGGDKDGQVDLFNVLRMATVREPASIINGNVLRVVDNKSIYYFSGGSHTAILQWCRAINSARRR